MNSTETPSTTSPHLRACLALRSVILDALRKDLPNGLYPYQIPASDRIINATLNATAEELFLSWCRQSGKTEAEVISILTLSVYYTKILKTHLRVGIFAPAGSQAVQIVKERLKMRYLKLRPLLKRLGLKLVTGDSIYSELFIIRNEGEGVDARIRCLSVGERTNITGETFHLILIEQSEDVDPLKLTQEVFPMAASGAGARILAGTPKDVVVNTYFYDALTKREDRSNILIVKWREAAKYNEKYALYVQNEMETLGAESIAFRTQYDCEWAGGIDKFSFLEEMEELTRKEPWSMPVVAGKSVFPIHVGWDPAKSSDRSIATFGVQEGDHIHIIGWMEFEGTDYMEQASRIAHELVRMQVEQICVDSAGAGDPVVEMLIAALSIIPGGLKITVVSIATNQPREEDRTAKLMVTVWKKRLLDYPGYTEARDMRQIRERAHFLQEFLDLNKIWKGSELLKLESPAGHNKHDDYPKSCGLLLRSILEPPIKLWAMEGEF